MEKKRILFVMHTMIGRGAERVLINILNRLDSSKYEVDLFLINKTGILVEEIPSWINVKHLVVGNDYLNGNVINKMFYKVYRRLVLKMALEFPKMMYLFKIKKNYDTEIAFLQWYTAHIVSNSPLKTKKLCWVHIDLSKTTGAYCNEIVFKEMDEIIFVSADAQKGFIERYPELSTIKMNVIYNMLDKEEILVKSLEPIEIKKNKFTLVAVGSLSKQKRFDRLILAAGQLIKRGYDIDVWIVGSGEEEKELQDLVISESLEHNIHFLGFQKNPYKFIKNADVFVMSSDYEGFSLVVGEAMILDKPIVSTDCAGPSELLDYGEYGLIVDKTPDSLANGIQRLIDEKQLQKYYIDKLDNRKQIFDPVIIANKIQEIM